MSGRQQMRPRIVELRERGLTFAQIGARLGLSRTTVHDYYSDPTGERARARKAKTNGTCRDCGATTTSDGSYTPERCKACAPKAQKAAYRAWTIECMQEWNRRFGQPPAARDWNQSMARTQGALDVIARYEATGRPWPCSTGVQGAFGSWNAAMKAAGFTPRGYGEHGHWIWTREAVLELLADRIAAGLSLRPGALQQAGLHGALAAARKHFLSLDDAIAAAKADDTHQEAA